MTLFWVVLIFLAGCLLLLSEFVLPGGILGIIGFVLLVGGCVWGMMSVPEYAMFILATETLGAILTFFAGMWIIANTRAGSALKLETSMNAEDGYQNMETDAALVGRTGVVVTPLRPSGTVDIDGRRLDVTADGAFIEADATVQVTSVSGNYIVVERASAANE